MDTYSHVLPGLDERAAATVARLILEGHESEPSGSIDKPLTTGRVVPSTLDSAEGGEAPRQDGTALSLDEYHNPVSPVYQTEEDKYLAVGSRREVVERSAIEESAGASTLLAGSGVAQKLGDLGVGETGLVPDQIAEHTCSTDPFELACSPLTAKGMPSG
jgi:hypothetical protein